MVNVLKALNGSTRREILKLLKNGDRHRQSEPQ